jgi:polyphosphate kinase
MVRRKPHPNPCANMTEAQKETVIQAVKTFSIVEAMMYAIRTGGKITVIVECKKQRDTSE